MLLILLLQASTTKSVTITEGVLPLVYGTLIVGVLSFLGSIAATIVASRTARKVAELSTKTTRETGELATQTARDIANLSAQVSRESAGLAAQTAQELKDKDYKNDFYKRIIEKRLKAWEEAEGLLQIMAPSVRSRKDNKSSFVYFSDGDKFDQVFKRLRNNMASQNLWMGKEYGEHLKSFHNKLAAIRRVCYKRPLEKLADGSFALGNELIKKAGKENYEEFKAAFNKLLALLSNQVQHLHEVELFFSELHKLRLYNETVPEETVPEETVPEETVPGETNK